MPVTFDLAPVVRRAKEKALAETHRIGDGWVLRESRSPALAKAAARAFAKAVRSVVVSEDGQELPWAVRGEVPLEDESSSCGCTVAVMRGVRMHLPEKVFGGNWLELHHEPTGFHLGWDPLSALQTWAREALTSLDIKRGGGKVWTGWASDADQLEQAWLDSPWSSQSTYSRREEWDWSFRTTYGGQVGRGTAAVGACERRVAQRCQHGLIRAGLPKLPGVGAGVGAGAGAGAGAGTGAGGDAGEVQPEWVECEPGAMAAPWDPKPRPARGDGDRKDGGGDEEEDDDDDDDDDDEEVPIESTLKLYEDFLSELGITQLLLRMRRYDAGWELRLRWWVCLNARCEPRRGVPHARMHDTTYVCVFGDDGGDGDGDGDDGDGAGGGGGATPRVVRRIEERELHFTPERMGEWEGSACMDADFMCELMPLCGAPRTHAASLAAPAAAAPAVAARATVAMPSGRAPQLSQLRRLGQMPSRVTCVAVPSDGTPLVAFGATDSGAIALAELEPGGDDAGSGLRWSVWRVRGGDMHSCLTHEGVEQLAFGRCGDGGLALLSCGADGSVRAWHEHGGALETSSCRVGGVGADLAAGIPIVQCVAAWCGDTATPPVASRLAAACGRSVVPLRLVVSSDGTGARCDLVADAARAPLPSPISDLRFASDGAALVAGTLHSGAYLWHLSSSAEDATHAVLDASGSPPPPPPPPPPSLHLPCGSSVASLHPIGAGAEWCAARCTDSTLRLWACAPAQHSLPYTNDGDAASAGAVAAPPMTFGGMRRASLWGGNQASLCHSDGAPRLLAVADQDGGVVVWRLEGSSVGVAALAVDSRRATRVVLPGRRRAMCVAAGADDATIAVGCDDGSVVVLAASAAGAWVAALDVQPLDTGGGDRPASSGPFAAASAAAERAVIGICWLRPRAGRKPLLCAAAASGAVGFVAV